MLTNEKKEQVKSAINAGPDSLRGVVEIVEDGLTKLARNPNNGAKMTKRYNTAKEFVFKALRALTED